MICDPFFSNIINGLLSFITVIPCQVGHDQWCDFWPYLMWNKQWYDIVLKCNGLWSNHEDGKFFLVTIKFQYLI